MAVPQNEVPQLSVEVENVRRSSIPVSCTNVEDRTIDKNREIDTNVNLELTTKLEQPGIKTNADCQKSDPEFGSMETIPLEVSVQEGASGLQTQHLENLNDSSLQPSSTNDLSKYFNVEASKQENVDSEGISFFNALAENTVKTKEENLFSIEQKNTLSENQQLPPFQETVQSEQDPRVAEESSGEGKDSENPPPILLKFFSEEKSGKDKDGKAFFDKILEDKSSGGFPTLEINEPILKMPATECFLNSPATNTEIEEAWIPSERTRQILVSIITSNMPFAPDKSDLTIPCVKVKEEMGDPVKALLIECNSPSANERKVLTANDVSQDEAGLQKLTENQCYHGAINLTKRLLISCGQGPESVGIPSNHTPTSLLLWYTRLALLVKIRKFSIAVEESKPFGDLDKPDMYYEFYPDIYKGKRGTMVPFALRLLLAELPQYDGKHQIALDNMYHILNAIQKMLSNVENSCAEDGSMIQLSDARKAASLEIWRKREKRVLFSILNCVLSQKDYIIAVSVAKLLIDKSGPDSAQLYSALGRIYLQLGDVQCAEKCFNKASEVAEENKQDFKAEENINNALLAVASDENEKAFKYFEQAYSLKPNPMLVNNMAVCKLYTGQLKESLQLLESAIKKSPLSYLHDGLIFNVCTLYELESSRCPQKKLAMLELVSRHAGDSFNVNSFKIQVAAPKA